MCGSKPVYKYRQYVSHVLLQTTKDRLLLVWNCFFSSVLHTFYHPKLSLFRLRWRVSDISLTSYHQRKTISNQAYTQSPDGMNSAKAFVSWRTCFYHKRPDRHLKRTLYHWHTKKEEEMSIKYLVSNWCCIKGLLSRVLVLWNRKMWLMAAHEHLTLTISYPNKHACSFSGMYAVVRFTLHLLHG